MTTWQTTKWYRQSWRWLLVISPNLISTTPTLAATMKTLAMMDTLEAIMEAPAGLRRLVTSTPNSVEGNVVNVKEPEAGRAIWTGGVSSNRRSNRPMLQNKGFPRFVWPWRRNSSSVLLFCWLVQLTLANPQSVSPLTKNWEAGNAAPFEAQSRWATATVLVLISQLLISREVVISKPPAPLPPSQKMRISE